MAHGVKEFYRAWEEEADRILCNRGGVQVFSEALGIEPEVRARLLSRDPTMRRFLDQPRWTQAAVSKFNARNVGIEKMIDKVGRFDSRAAKFMTKLFWSPKRLEERAEPTARSRDLSDLMSAVLECFSDDGGGFVPKLPAAVRDAIATIANFNPRAAIELLEVLKAEAAKADNTMPGVSAASMEVASPAVMPFNAGCAARDSDFAARQAYRYEEQMKDERARAERDNRDNMDPIALATLIQKERQQEAERFSKRKFDRLSDLSDHGKGTQTFQDSGDPSEMATRFGDAMRDAFDTFAEEGIPPGYDGTSTAAAKMVAERHPDLAGLASHHDLAKAELDRFNQGRAEKMREW